MYYAIILAAALVSAGLIQLIYSRRERKLSLSVLVSCFMSSLAGGGVISRLLLNRIYGKNYAFMNFSGKHVWIATLIILIVDIFFILFFCQIETRCFKSGREEIIKCGRRSFIPFVSLQYFAVIVGVVYIVLAIADSVMPQFSYWYTENDDINNMTYAHVTINENNSELGYPIYDLPKGEDEKIILVVGDSFIWGDGTSNINNIWWRVLERRFNEEGYDNVKVIGVGWRGASTEHEYQWLSQTTLLEDVNPDLIIIGYVTNDPLLFTEDMKTEVPLENPTTHIGWFPVSIVTEVFPNVMTVIDDQLSRRDIAVWDPVKKGGYHSDLWEIEMTKGEELQKYYDRAIKPLGDFLDKKDAKCFLLTTPNKPDYEYFTDRYKNVLPLFEKAGISVYNCLDDFVERHKDDEEYSEGINPVNGHPGIATNKYYADYAYQIIQSDYSDFLNDNRHTDENLSLEINDWYPYDVLKPEIDGNFVSIDYSDSWSSEKFLYLPEFSNHVKICFRNGIDCRGGLAVRDSDGNVRTDMAIWLSYIGDEGYEVTSEDLLECNNDLYICDHDNVTAIHLHAPNGTEERLSIEFFK